MPEVLLDVNKFTARSDEHDGLHSRGPTTNIFYVEPAKAARQILDTDRTAYLIWRPLVPRTCFSGLVRERNCAQKLISYHDKLEFPKF